MRIKAHPGWRAFCTSFSPPSPSPPDYECSTTQGERWEEAIIVIKCHSRTESHPFFAGVCVCVPQRSQAKDREMDLCKVDWLGGPGNLDIILYKLAISIDALHGPVSISRTAMNLRRQRWPGGHSFFLLLSFDT